MSVVSFPSTVSTNSLMVLMKNFSDTRGEDAAVLLMAWTFCAMASRTGACARRMAV